MLSRTPYSQLPITLLNKALEQKYYRQLHCIECGWPLAEITDKVIMLSDSGTSFEKLLPDAIGLIELHCKRHNCKQYYRMEFAI